ncbi:MAG: MogA/MoaB family molybdenum cofactor biosynthesis protein [Myxococcota bacterium]|jgi:molybdenum cofactor biosynthesis protein B
MGHHDHKHSAREIAAKVHVITVSDTRSEAQDTSGSFIRSAVEEAGHKLSGYTLLRDEPEQISAKVREIAGGRTADVVIINGGTGISRRDSTFEAIDAMLQKRIPGFGELFRMLSYEEIGPAAMMSRATAGLFDGLAVFSIPGSEKAVRLAVSKLILPELAHVVWEASR